ncbi:MAG: NADP-dependent oxidoreductase [Candidatus Nitrosocosmicus sp.]
MKSAQINRYGSSDVIEINQNAYASLPTSSGEILVDVMASGVNPVDWKIREGYMQQMIPLQFPATLGMDFSGVIKDIGSDQEVSTADLKQGDKVYGQASVTKGGSGAFAEVVVTNADNIAFKPKNLTFEEAAALPLVGVSAWQALVENMNLSQDQKILIHGGAGGIGSIAIQLAKNLGAFVATTVNSEDIQYVQSLGADETIDYKKQDFEKMANDYDAVYDTVGGQTYLKSFNVLKKGGIIVSMLEQPNTDLMQHFGVKSIFLLTQVNKERLTQLANWVDQNNIKINIDKTFSLDETAKALEYVKDVHPRGKVIIEIKS